MSRNGKRITRQEIINLVQEVAAAEEWGMLTNHRFMEQTGVPQHLIYRYFGTWMQLKMEAGLPPGRPRRRVYSDEMLLEQLHEVVMRLRRFPKAAEIRNEPGLSFIAMNTRWGKIDGIRRRYVQWLKDRTENGEEPLNQPDHQAYNIQQDMPDSSLADVRWMRRTWQGMKVAFELVSSDFENRPHWDCDLLVVLKHDWPACPVQVIELAHVLPEHKEVRPRPTEAMFSQM